jgi:hypothetical protein
MHRRVLIFKVSDFFFSGQATTTYSTEQQRKQKKFKNHKISDTTMA